MKLYITLVILLHLAASKWFDITSKFDIDPPTSSNIDNTLNQQGRVLDDDEVPPCTEPDADGLYEG